MSLTACKNDEKFIGEWKLVEIDYAKHLASINPELRSSFQSMADRQGQSILGKTFFKFEANGDLVITSPKFDGGVAKDEGKWSLNEQKDTLMVMNSDSENFAFELKGDKTMILSSVQKPLRVLTLIRE